VIKKNWRRGTPSTGLQESILGGDAFYPPPWSFCHVSPPHWFGLQFAPWFFPICNFYISFAPVSLAALCLGLFGGTASVLAALSLGLFGGPASVLAALSLGLFGGPASVLLLLVMVQTQTHTHNEQKRRKHFIIVGVANLDGKVKLDVANNMLATSCHRLLGHAPHLPHSFRYPCTYEY